MEHVRDPLLMLREMCRVAKRRVVVRVLHREAGGAKETQNVNYFNEQWFKEASEFLGYEGRVVAMSYDYPISSRLSRITPSILQAALPWRELRRFERTRLNLRVKQPLEIEARIIKKKVQFDSNNIRFVVVYNLPQIFETCFASSPYVSGNDVAAFYNEKNEPLPKFFNDTVREHLQEDVWCVFCHQDFILKEALLTRLKGKNVEAIYGPIGGSVADPRLLGRIVQANNCPIGVKLKEDATVQTLDEMCIIANSAIFRQGLVFDERFRFHFYGADLCMQAYRLGFDVFAMQLDCQHRSRTPTGDLSSPEYLASLELFKEKWKQFLPIHTTTGFIA